MNDLVYGMVAKKCSVKDINGMNCPEKPTKNINGDDVCSAHFHSFNHLLQSVADKFYYVYSGNDDDIVSIQSEVQFLQENYCYMTYKEALEQFNQNNKQGFIVHIDEISSFL